MTITTSPFLYIFIALFLLYLPVLAAAPDIQYPFSRISPANTPILPKNPRQLGEILQKTPLFYPKIIKNPTFYPPNLRKPHFSLKNLLNPHFF